MKFAFLIYQSRSGSTFLARQLAIHSRDLIVLPENLLLVNLLALGDQQVRQMSAGDKYELFRRDRRLVDVLTDAQQREIADGTENLGIRSIMQSVVQAYAANCGKNPTIAVVKLGQLVYISHAVQREFPDSKFLHIYRDPRAVVNSILRTKQVRDPRKSLGRGDIVYAAKSWRRMMRRVEDLKTRHAELLIEVQYERLCAETLQVVRELVCAVDATYDAESLPEWEYNVSGSEQHLHSLIQSEPAVERVEAWHSELEPWKAIVVEWICRKESYALGYQSDLLHSARHGQVIAALSWAGLVHCQRTLRHYWHVSKFYLFRFSALRARISLSRLRLRTSIATRREP